MNAYKRVHFHSVGSTNDYAKSLRKTGENTIVSADWQTGGRGTKGRSFSSEKGGVYLSALTFYRDFPAKNAFLITVGAAVAVCKTLVFFGLCPKIKWANDVFVGKKKICGILIENVFSGQNVQSSVVGIGLNVQNALPKELQEIATTVFEETGKNIPVERVRERLIEELSSPANIEEYRSFLGFLHEEVSLVRGEERYLAKLLGVDEDGGLLVEMQGKREKFYAGEVSVRI